MQLKAGDIVVSGNVSSWLSDLLYEKRVNGQLKHTGDGRYRFTIPEERSLEGINDISSVIKYLNAMQRHREYIEKNLLTVFDPMVLAKNPTNMTYPVIHGGIQSKWSWYELNAMMTIKPESIPRITRGLLSPVADSNTRWRLSLNQNPSTTLIGQSYARARMEAVASAFTLASRTGEPPEIYLETNYVRLADGGRAENISITTLPKLRQLVETAHSNSSVPARQVWDARQRILAERSELANRDKNVLRDVNKSTFVDYWTNLKSVIAGTVSHTEAHNAWSSIPLLPSGTSTSRTWGIEIETVQANLVPYRPAGWERKGDGSLEALSDDCSCDCDYCYEGEHYECGSDDCSGACAEFVSPILNNFNSEGLRVLTNALDGSEVNTTPGIHVHVGASDLSVSDVARLVRSYSAVAPYVLAVSYREVTNYCKEVSNENVRFWLAEARDHVRNGLGRNAIDVTYSQPDDRYHDINLQSLRQHGTVEFRVMGPHYNYDHLVRWAWFCREMVNVAKLDLPQRLWTSVRSMEDVLTILFQYGSERSPEAWVQANKANPMDIERAMESA